MRRELNSRPRTQHTLISIHLFSLHLASALTIPRLTELGPAQWLLLSRKMLAVVVCFPWFQRKKSRQAVRLAAELQTASRSFLLPRARQC